MTQHTPEIMAEAERLAEDIFRTYVKAGPLNATPWADMRDKIANALAARDAAKDAEGDRVIKCLKKDYPTLNRAFAAPSNTSPEREGMITDKDQRIAELTAEIAELRKHAGALRAYLWPCVNNTINVYRREQIITAVMSYDKWRADHAE